MSRHSHTIRLPFVLLLSLALLPVVAARARAAGAKYVIFHQWGGPKVADVVRNARKLEALPFDGLTVSIPASGQLMLGDPMDADEMRRDLAPMKGAFVKFRHNFVVIHTRRPPDPFDDWTVEIRSWRAMAQAARAAGLVGIFYDNECYKETVWTFPRDFKYPARGLDAYRDQMRLRGRQVMQAVVAEFPTVVLLTFHGPYVSDPRTPDAVTMSQAGARAQDLRGAFFVGMVEGGGPQATVVDGGECYQYRSAADFERSYRWRKYELASPSGNSVVIPPALRRVYPQRVSIAFATFNKQWLPRFPMNATIMRSALTNALRRTDKYVWCYVEGDWVNGSVPPDWAAAIRDAVAAGKR